jgi:hypothetical protein
MPMTNCITMDFAGEDDPLHVHGEDGFSGVFGIVGLIPVKYSSAATLVRIPRRRFLFFLASYVYVSSCLGSNARGCAAAILACVSGLRYRSCVCMNMRLS